MISRPTKKVFKHLLATFLFLWGNLFGTFIVPEVIAYFTNIKIPGTLIGNTYELVRMVFLIILPFFILPLRLTYHDDKLPVIKKITITRRILLATFLLILIVSVIFPGSLELDDVTKIERSYSLFYTVPALAYFSAHIIRWLLEFKIHPDK